MAAAETLSQTSDRAYENAYGYFRRSDKAFVITDIRTPRPWVNVMSNGRYGLVLSQSGGGFSWLDNCQLFRLSRWEQDLVQDTQGRFVYIEDLELPGLLWSTTFQPTASDAEEESVEHGLGWTRFTRAAFGIRSEHTVFVPDDFDGELWLISLTNETEREARLRVSSYLEWHLGDVGDWHREYHRLFMESKVAGDTLVAWKHPNLSDHKREEMEEPIRAACRWSHGDTKWLTDKGAFLGREGSVRQPAALTIELPERSSTPRWDDPIAAGVFDVEIGPGETQVFLFTLVAARGEQNALALSRRYDVPSAQKALDATKRAWLDRCAAVRVQSGDADVDFLANSWLAYQTIAGRLDARCAYYQQGGAFGYRDQLQDSMMLLRCEPETTLEQIGRHAEAMFWDGGVRHWWHPGTNIGPESWHSDTSLWLAFGTLAYLEETGDRTVLDREYAYLGRDSDVPWVRSVRPESPNIPAVRGTLLDHCLRGIDRALSLRSVRGLPLIGAGDWNDGLSHAGLEGKGESVWLGMFLYDILVRMTTVLESRGEFSKSESYRLAAQELRESVNLHGWDGDWYIAGTRDDGKPLGSRDCSEGRIFLNPQTWAVISGIAPEDRAARALASAKEHLVTPYGALLLQPAYTTVDPYVGYITRYAPGLRENGGVYSHASTWAVWAFAKAGDLETARSIYRGMLPSLRAESDADLYAAEPYVMPGNADGPDSPYASRAGWTWYTGSSAWMVRLAERIRG